MLKIIQRVDLVLKMKIYQKRKEENLGDTAFWNAIINTDNNGYAHVEFKLPDNLTTWQIETVGITKRYRARCFL